MVVVAINFLVGCYGRIASRSGLALYSSIIVCAGVIDADYRGPINVILLNYSNKEFNISVGDRIAQLICEKILIPDLELVSELDDTKRGSNGFGSTGV